MFDLVKKDINAIKERDPAARTSFEILVLYSGLHAVMLHRPAHWLYKRKMYTGARFISQVSRFLTGVEIHPGAKIGRGVLIDHGLGVVIGETAEIGDNCTLYQGVTLGGTGKDTGKRHPTLGKGVLVGAGAKVLGPFKIEDGAVIAANAVVLQPIPAGATAVGVPARIVKRKDKSIRKNILDHVHSPDPLSQEICKMQAEISRLNKKIEKLEQNSKERGTKDNETVQYTNKI